MLIKSLIREISRKQRREKRNMRNNLPDPGFSVCKNPISQILPEK
jgi:hypothetical protein